MKLRCDITAALVVIYLLGFGGWHIHWRKKDQREVQEIRQELEKCQEDACRQRADEVKFQDSCSLEAELDWWGKSMETLKPFGTNQPHPTLSERK